METREEYSTGEDDQAQVRDARTERRFFVDNVIIRGYGPELGVYGIAVYASLCMHANLKTQQCFPAHQTIAKEIGCCVAKVKEAIRRLRELKLICIEPRYDPKTDRRTSNLYTLLDPPVPPATTDTLPSYTEVARNNPNSEQSSLDQCDADASHGDPPSEENKPPPQTKAKTKKTTPAAVRRFRSATHRYPAKSWYQEIDALVGEEEGNLTFWYDVCHAWVGLGWNPTNIKGMMAFYATRTIPPGKRANGGSSTPREGANVKADGYRAVPQR